MPTLEAAREFGGNALHGITSMVGFVAALITSEFFTTCLSLTPANCWAVRAVAAALRVVFLAARLALAPGTFSDPRKLGVAVLRQYYYTVCLAACWTLTISSLP